MGRRTSTPSSVELAPQGFNILLGPTLAGKTTLMRLMAGLLKPTAGEIWFNGQNVTGVPVRDARRGDGLPAVHQLRAPLGLRQHRLAVAGCAA